MSNLQGRAAEYFGLSREPRESVVLGRCTVAILSGNHLYLYDEQAPPTMAIHVNLTDGRRASLAAALTRKARTS